MLAGGARLCGRALGRAGVLGFLNQRHDRLQRLESVAFKAIVDVDISLSARLITEALGDQ